MQLLSADQAGLHGAASMETLPEESGIERMPIAWVPILCDLILFLLTVSSAQANAVVSKDLVYVDSETAGRILAYETDTLNLRWTTDLSSLGIDGPLSISVEKQDVYVSIDTPAGGALAALSAATGSGERVLTCIGSPAPSGTLRGRL